MASDVVHASSSGGGSMSHPSRACLRGLHAAGESSKPAVHELAPRSDKQSWTIGRENSDLHMDSTNLKLMISRQHALITFEPCDALRASWSQSSQSQEATRLPSSCTCRWRLADLRSTNGLFVNDVKSLESVLDHGDLVVFGSGHGLAVGSRKRLPNHEFAFRFEVTHATNEPRRPHAAAAAAASNAAAADARAAVVHAAESSAPSVERSNSNSGGAKRKHAEADAAHAENESEPSRLAAQVAHERRLQEAEEVRLREEAAQAEQVRLEEAASASRAQQAAEEQLKQAEIDRARAAADEQRARDQRAAEEERLRVKEAEQSLRRESEEQKRDLLRTEQDAHTATSSAAAGATADPVAATPAAAAAAITSTETSPLSREALESLLQDHTCTICSQLLLAYDELPCGHRFDRVCLTDWFTRRHTTCPLCSVEVDFRFAYRPLGVNEYRAHNHTIDLLAASGLLTPSEKVDRAQRSTDIEKRDAKERKREKQLKEHMDKARAAQKTVLRITDPWRESERRTFRTGISVYTFHGRLEYANFVGLTPEMLQQVWTVDVAMRIADNLEVELPKETRESLAGVADELRTRDIHGPDSDAFTNQEKSALDNCKRLIYLFIAFGYK